MGSGKKIGILINCLEVGGAQKMALQLFDMLHQTDLPLFLITTDSTVNMLLHTDEKRVEVLRENLICLSGIDINQPTICKIVAAPVQYLRLNRCLRKLNIDTVISFEDRANIFNLLLLPVKNRIISIRHPMKSVLEVKTPVKKILIFIFFSLFISRVTKVNFNSYESMEEFRSLFKVSQNKLSVIYNFCDHEKFNHLKNQNTGLKAYNGFLRTKFIVACGRLKPVKGFACLIRAFAEIVKEKPGLKLVILGDGPLKKELEDLSRDLGVKDAVVFTGFVNNTAPWIANAEMFVLTSQSEGFPNVLLEAMALKRAVISADCSSGPREILSPESDYRYKTNVIDFAEYGILIPPMTNFTPALNEPLTSSEQLLADAVITVLNNSDIKIKYENAGYQRSLDFTGNYLHKKWLDLIRGV